MYGPCGRCRLKTIVSPYDLRSQSIAKGVCEYSVSGMRPVRDEPMLREYGTRPRGGLCSTDESDRIPISLHHMRHSSSVSRYSRGELSISIIVSHHEVLSLHPYHSPSSINYLFPRSVRYSFQHAFYRLRFGRRRWSGCCLSHAPGPRLLSS